MEHCSSFCCPAVTAAPQTPRVPVQAPGRLVMVTDWLSIVPTGVSQLHFLKNIAALRLFCNFQVSESVWIILIHTQKKRIDICMPGKLSTWIVSQQRVLCALEFRRFLHRAAVRMISYKPHTNMFQFVLFILYFQTPQCKLWILWAVLFA